MQLSTLQADGSPTVCNVWYDFSFSPDRLRFISRVDRNHCANIRTDPRVAGGIIAIELQGLGQTVQGVTYTGTAHELPTADIDAEIDAFIRRWPAASPSISADSLLRGRTTSRLYEIQVDTWILFDEQNFPDQPRQVITPPPTAGV
jgi:Pyridoxamine 5'-phosphate oxidase